jgi:hypothetical protein
MVVLTAEALFMSSSCGGFGIVGTLKMVWLEFPRTYAWGVLTWKWVAVKRLNRC